MRGFESDVNFNIVSQVLKQECPKFIFNNYVTVVSTG